MRPLYLTGVGILLLAANAAAAVHYVDLESSGPEQPYDSWSTAAQSIQDAVDIAAPGDEIVVTNGVYRTGGRVVIGTVTNRVAVTKPVTVRSVNGPDATVIEGYQLPGTTNGDGAVRCVYLTNGAFVVGFTLTNGATRSPGAGVPKIDLDGAGVWCESTNAILTNCRLVRNSAGGSGGGAYRGTLNNCILTRNSADSHWDGPPGFVYGTGGGATEALLNSCSLVGNSGDLGGGVANSALSNCTLIGNFARHSGGGGYYSTMDNSTLTENVAGSDGGGAYEGTLNNCVLTLNSADWGGGATGSALKLNNCTLTGNVAIHQGGGVAHGALNNCISYYNSALRGDNYAEEGDWEVTLNYCCTTPLPPNGIGNITAEPLLASASHLSAESPARGAGITAQATGVDIDGEAWASPPSIGCDEYVGGAGGPLAANIRSDHTNVAPGFVVKFALQVSGHATVSRWDFGDGTVVSNRPHVSHSWPSAGDFEVVAQAYNESSPQGVFATQKVHVVEGLYHVAIDSPNPVPPYTSWATAATNIQDAVDVALPGGTILVSNGVYRFGGRRVGALTNRLVVTTWLNVRSVNGPAETAIEGYRDSGSADSDRAVRCVYLMAGTTLAGFTLKNGATRGENFLPYESRGGGVWCDTTNAWLSNCVITANAALYGGGASGGSLYRSVLSNNWAFEAGGGAENCSLDNCIIAGNFTAEDRYGGGVAGCTLRHSTLAGNTALGGDSNGGAAITSTLNNCVLRNNSAGGGGGASYCTLSNCVLFANSAFYAAAAEFSTLVNCTLADNSVGPIESSTLNNCIIQQTGGATYSDSILNYCCTTPLPDSGAGNFTNAPIFVDLASGDLRLLSNSPCINAGHNSYSENVSDLAGNPRRVGGTVDVGAYEFQTPASVISYGWLQRFGLSLDGSFDYLDTDGDGMSTWQEWVADTDPTNSLSLLSLLPPVLTDSGLTLSWASVTGRNYFVERGIGFDAQAPFSTVATNIVGEPQLTTHTDTNIIGSGQFFYRVGVRR